MNEVNNNINQSNFQLQCKRCGAINNSQAHVCSNCGRSLLKNVGCLASTIVMFTMAGFNLLLLIILSIILFFIGSSMDNSFLVIFVLLFRVLRVISLIAIVIFLILGIIFYKKTRK